MDELFILIAEDDDDDRFLLQSAFEENGFTDRLLFVENGLELIDHLNKLIAEGGENMPRFIMLDLNMPKKDGKQVLGELKSDDRFKRIPIVILTVSKAEEDIIRSYDLHANCFITKPIDLDQFIHVVKSIEDFWFTIVKLPPNGKGVNK